jgi:hypothetical protein
MSNEKDGEQGTTHTDGEKIARSFLGRGIKKEQKVATKDR